MVDVFYYDAFQQTINPQPEDGPLVRYSDYAALEAQLAELAAENERLKQEAAEWEVIARAKSEEALTHRREAEAMMSALARTGAVKVKALAGIGQYHLDNWTDDDFRKHIPAVRAALSDAIARLAALEPAAPEDQQDDARIRREMDEILRKQSERDIPFAPVDRPSEQAVAEAMVEAACRAWINASSPLDAAMRAALKAAMEAGRHD